MALSFSYTSAVFKMIGDGVTTSADLSLNDYPFVDMPRRTPSSIFLVGSAGGHLTSAVITGSIITLTFDITWTGDSLQPIQIGFYFDLP